MITSKNLPERTFEDLLQEARMQIPLYTEEWTNFNPSDPAVTILENLSAFTILQQAYIDRVPEGIQEKLFALAGFQRHQGKSARVLLEARSKGEAALIPANQRFTVGDLSFETNREVKLYGHRLTGIFGCLGDVVNDYSYVLDPDIPLQAAIFTKEPKAGMELYLVADGLGEPGEEIIFYARNGSKYPRNGFEGSNMFAEIRWQYYTEKGFMDIRCRDQTGCFLTDGEIRFRLPGEPAAPYEGLPVKGYVLRGTLERVDYDIPPSLIRLSGFLFEVWQKETGSLCYTFSAVGGKKAVKRKAQEDTRISIEVACDMLEEGYMQLFCREEDGRYRRYMDARTGTGQGRLYEMEHLGFGRFRFHFDQAMYGFGPGRFDNAIKLVAYHEPIMQRYSLGRVYGYDDQEIALPVKNLVRDSFSVLAARQGEDGATVFDFVKPDSTREDEFRYSLNESEGVIRIEDAGDFLDAQLFLCGCAVSRGAEGNIRADSEFHPAGYDTETRFFNPAPGAGGRLAESLKELKGRFLADVSEPYTAVEAADYEKLVRGTPELCIHKVKAVMDTQRSQVNIAVKPYGDGPFPEMDAIYRKAIERRLEERRLLTAHIVLLQPVYVPVSVRGVIYVKPHYENCRGAIEKVIRERLDYISTDRNFGERLPFDELFHSVERLDCVDFIYELSLSSRNTLLAVPQGLDIQPADNCLLYPGEIKLDLNTLEG